MKKENRKVICNGRKCNWKGLEKDILTVPNPFEPRDTINGCPSCKNVDTIIYACDEPGCWEAVACGTSTPQGYRSTCGEHQPK